MPTAAAVSTRVSLLTALNRPQIAHRRPWQNPDPTYYDEWRVDARDKFAGTSPTHSVPVALLSSCMTLALLFAAQLKEERELSGSEASLPSSRWDSADEDAGGPNPKLRPPLDLDAFDRATQPVGERKPRHLSDECATHSGCADPRNVWKVDSSLSEGEVAWPQSAAGPQTVDGCDPRWPVVDRHALTLLDRAGTCKPQALALGRSGSTGTRATARCSLG